MVDFFIHRPVFSTVCALLIILAGAVCIPTLPIAQFPDLAPPQVAVTAVYTGASAQTVESAVTTPLEQQINGAEGMTYITSASTNSGVSSITATFALTRDPDLAAVDIQNRVNTAQGRLPNAVKQVGVTVAKTSENFVFGAAVFSPDQRYSTLFMSNYLDVYVRDPLKRVPGVADVQIFGERKYSMRLWLDPVRMASRALTADDVVSALQEQNVEVAAGQVGSQPSIPDQQFQISVRAVGRLLESCPTCCYTARVLPLRSAFLAALLIAPPPAPAQETDKPSGPTPADTFAGLKLRSIGPAVTSGRVVSFAVHPKDKSTYYAGAASGGVWKTVNAGTSFAPVFDGEGSYSIGTVAIDAKNSTWCGSARARTTASAACPMATACTVPTTGANRGRTWD